MKLPVILSFSFKFLYGLSIKSILRLLNSGFTLVELLVVTSIIAVLALVGVAMYSNVTTQGRDAQRLNDAKSIETALEQYYTDQNTFPPFITPGTPLQVTATPGVPSKTYLKTIPQDPRGTSWGDYSYKSYNWVPAATPAPCNGSAPVCNEFCVSLHLENNPILAGTPAPTPNSGCPLTAPYNYQVNSQTLKSGF